MSLVNSFCSTIPLLLFYMHNFRKPRSLIPSVSSPSKYLPDFLGGERDATRASTVVLGAGDSILLGLRDSLFFFLDLNYSATRPRSRGVRLKIMTYVKFHFHVLSIMYHPSYRSCVLWQWGGGGGGGGGGAYNTGCACVCLCPITISVPTLACM